MPGQTAVQRSLSTGTAIPERILFGHSELMHTVRNRIEKVAQTAVPVLIIGESGAGKEVIARYVHSRSQRYGSPFVRINCQGTKESELFTNEKSALAGGSVWPRLLESAADGTLFLDGIGELDLSLQSRLVQILQDIHPDRSGSQESVGGNARFICAASRPLEEEVAEGRFRRDLLYRLNVVTLSVPALRNRRGDIPDLIDYFLQLFSHEFGRIPDPIRPATRNLLASSDWPGNIRQLENLIKLYVILDSEDALLADLCAHERSRSSHSRDEDVSLKDVTQHAKRDLERKVILDALAANNWNRRRTAEALHISYRALLYKIKQGGLPSKKSMSAAAGKS